MSYRSAQDWANRSYYAPDNISTRLSVPIIITLAVGLVSLALAIAKRQDTNRLWESLVRLTPAFVIYLLDRWLNTPMFPGLATPRYPTTHAEKSERMAAVFGATGVSRAIATMRPVMQSLARPSSNFIRPSLLGRAALRGQPAGLGNMDNSCYQNSILQGLASLDHLAPYLESAIGSSTEAEEVRAARALRDLLRKLRDPGLDGKVLWTPGVLKNMSSWVQQDAQEYYSKLLDEVDSGIAKGTRQTTRDVVVDWVDNAKDDSSEGGSDDSGYHSSTPSGPKISAGRPARSPLEGMLGQKVTCGQCGYTEGISLSPFNCLTLSLGLNTIEHDLYERLDAYTKIEHIEGVQCPRCTLTKLQRLLPVLRTRASPQHQDRIATRLAAVSEALEDEDFSDKTLKEKCGITSQSMAVVTKTKQVVVARPPKSLVVHMNRSVFDDRTGAMFKNTAGVKFPMALDLGPWCLGSAKGRSNAKPGEDVVDEETWTTDANASMVAGDRNPSLISGPMYELRAVVTHYGNHHNGHYICYRKHYPTTSAGLEKTESTKWENDDDPPDPADDVTEKAGHDGRETEADPTTLWWRISDENVMKVDEEFVLQQGGVFMLFYDCVDQKPVLTSDLEESTLVGSEKAVEGMSESPPDASVSHSSSLAPELVPLPDDDDDDTLDEYESVFDEDQREETPMTVADSPAAAVEVVIEEPDVDTPTVDEEPCSTTAAGPKAHIQDENESPTPIMESQQTEATENSLDKEKKENSTSDSPALQDVTNVLDTSKME